MVVAYVGLGGNIGDSRRAISEAIRILSAKPEIGIIAVSPLYRTSPWGPVIQASYRNACLSLETSLSPRETMDLLLSVEREMGRDRLQETRWGPRIIDLDLLIHGHTNANEPDLVLPHPRLMERAFVLAPLCDLAPEMQISGLLIKEALRRVGWQGIEREESLG